MPAGVRLALDRFGARYDKTRGGVHGAMAVGNIAKTGRSDPSEVCRSGVGPSRLAIPCNDNDRGAQTVAMIQVLKQMIPSRLRRGARSILGCGAQEVHDALVVPWHEDNDQVLNCSVAYNRYGGYCVPQSSRHRPAARTVLSGGVWEPDTIEFMVKHAVEGDIVHAGTYFGDFIPALSQSCGTRAKLWAFEPNPENYRCALITIAINNLKNVRILNAGLGSEHGLLPMKISDRGGTALGGASRLVVPHEEAAEGRFVEVEIVRLDDVVPPDRRVAILQLDVEGFEQSALGGAMATIRRCKPVIILENVPEPDWFCRTIQSLGYAASGTLHENTVFAVPE